MAPYLYNIYILALDTFPSISELPETKRITWAKNQKKGHWTWNKERPSLAPES